MVLAGMEPNIPLDADLAVPPANNVLRRPVPGIVESIGLSLLFYILVVVVAVPLEMQKQLGLVSLDAPMTLAIEFLIAWPIVMWICTRWSKTPFRQASRMRPFAIRIVPALIVASLGATILLLEVVSWIPMSDTARAAMSKLGDSSKFTLFLPVVVLAPIAEELFFRGQVLHGYLGRYSTTKAVWASAILFAIFHLNPWQAVIALPLGLAYGWLLLRTGSVLPGMLSHAVVNFSTNYLLGPISNALGYSDAELAAMSHFPPALLGLGATLAVVGSIHLWRQLASSVTPQVAPSSATDIQQTDSAKRESAGELPTL